MSGYLVGAPVVLAIDDIKNGAGVLTNPATINLILRAPNGGATTHPVGDLTHVSTGAYEYVFYGAPGDGGEWAWRWEHTNPTNALEGTFVIDESSLLAGDAQVPRTGPCSPWTDYDEVQARGTLPTLAGEVGIEEAVAQAIEAASDVLYQLGGRRWPGVCDATVQVQNLNPWALPLPEGGSVGWRDPAYWAGGGYWAPGGMMAGFYWREQGAILTLPGPILSIKQIRLAGVVLDASAYRIVDWSEIVRVDGGVWPVMGLITDATPAIEIDYTFGQAPPQIGRMAAASLARELVLAFTGDDACRLDRRVKAIIREGITEEMGLGLPGISESLRDGNTGIPEVDLFVHTHNPSHLKRPARLLGLGRRTPTVSRRS